SMNPADEGARTSSYHPVANLSIQRHCRVWSVVGLRSGVVSRGKVRGAGCGFKASSKQPLRGFCNYLLAHQLGTRTCRVLEQPDEATVRGRFNPSPEFLAPPPVLR